MCSKHFVKTARCRVDQDDVSVAARLHRHVLRDRVLVQVAFIFVVECDIHRLGARRHFRVGNPVTGSEIGVDRPITHRAHVGIGVRIHFERVDPRIPHIVFRKHRAASHMRTRPCTRLCIHHLRVQPCFVGGDPPPHSLGQHRRHCNRCEGESSASQHFFGTHCPSQSTEINRYRTKFIPHPSAEPHP